MPHDSYWPDAPVAATGRFQRGPNPLESRPDVSGGHRLDAARVWSPSLDVFMIYQTLNLLLTGCWKTLFQRLVTPARQLFTSYELTER